MAEGVKNKHDHHALHKLLQGIPYVILKGQASAYYYPEPGLRQAGDVDFLIDTKKRDEVGRMLETDGYVKDKHAEDHNFHWLYQKGNEVLEMHWEAPGIPIDGRDVICEYLDNIIDDAVLVESEQGSYYMPSPFHHGLVLLLHSASHLTAGGIGLRQLCDWLTFENSLSDQDFVRMFEEPLRRIGLWKFAQVMTRTGVLYLGCRARTWCDDIDDKLCKAFIEDVLDAGNLGHKDSKRGDESKLIRDNKTRKVASRSSFRNLFSNLNDKAKKHNAPLPIGWLIVIAQYLKRVLSGNGSDVMDKQVQLRAKKRKQLYSQLKLFD